MPQIVQWRCPQSTLLSQALTVSVSSTRSVVGPGQAGQILGLTGRFGLLRKSFETSRSLVLQGIGETSVRRGTLRPSRSFVVLRGMRNHQFAVILLVKAATLGDISVKQERHAMSNGVQPSLCELAWARDRVPSPATHPKSRLSQPNSRLCLKRRNNLPIPTIRLQTNSIFNLEVPGKAPAVPPNAIIRDPLIFESTSTIRSTEPTAPSYSLAVTTVFHR